VNFFDFLISYLSQTATFGYLVLFNFEEVNPAMRVVIIILLCLRFLLSLIGSIAVYAGLKQELVKVLAQLGTDLKRAKSVREMVLQVQDGET